MPLSARWIARSLIVLFWVSLIFAFLWLPSISIFKPSKTITVFTWARVLDPHYIREFEKQTGIGVYVSYYESNQELFSKLVATKGEGYDLVIPSDHTVARLKDLGLLKKLDRSQLHFWSDLNPGLMGHYFDPDNEYSIPYYWGLYGLGIDKRYFKNVMPPSTWGLIFDKKIAPSSVAMTDDARDVIMIAAQYLFGSIDNLTDEKLAQIEQLLIEQKKWVEIYTEARAEELLVSQSCPVVTTTGPELWLALQDDENISFLIPEEGTFAVIDSFIIPAASQKEEMVYQFLNFMFEKDVLKHHLEKFGFCSPVLSVENSTDEAFCILPLKSNNVDFFRNVIPQKKIDDLWVSLMAR